MSNRIDYKHKCLRVSGETMAQLRDLMDNSGKNTSQKIQAIKLLRNETKCGLKEAKQAVERKFQPSLGTNSEALDIRTLMSIKSITVDFGEGDVKLDLEELQMMTLVNMTQLGLSEVRRILDLHELLTRWEDPSIGGSDDDTD